MREYVEGDDLRKIHWPATAKRGGFMIRQEETPWHTRATILLDDRVESHGGIGESSSFERPSRPPPRSATSTSARATPGA